MYTPDNEHKAFEMRRGEENHLTTVVTIVSFWDSMLVSGVVVFRLKFSPAPPPTTHERLCYAAGPLAIASVNWPPVGL